MLDVSKENNYFGYFQEDAAYHSIREVLTFLQPPISEHVSF